jgi:hypothetical protein
MRMIDPTYLRTINDGLLSGAINKDNASALPIGLIGVYEKALPPANNVNERKKFLEFFVVWALLKKEVSAGFVVDLLEGWAEDQVIDFIAQYSKWFNSPVSGKYVLYHERLRTFILQRESANHFKKCNEQIIHQCQFSLQVKAGDEWERYALEHLSSHMLIIAMDSSDGSALKELAYDTTHWNRQIEISKDFEWSKRLLNDMMFWASKYDDDQVIECALNKVDLHHMEQNDAPRIVQLVAENDIETALIRIEAFGGNDKEGIQRKFILYMLCLMELTLLDSKDKPFRKIAIEKLLKHLDENLPVDHSVLNWNDFFPSYLMFIMSRDWVDLGLDFLGVFKFSSRSNILFDWINNVRAISKSGLEVLYKLFDRITDDIVKEDYINRLKTIDISDNDVILFNNSASPIEEKALSNDLPKEELISLINKAENIEDTYDRILALIDLGYKLFVQETEIDFYCYIDQIIDAIDKLQEDDDMILKSYSYSDLAGLLNNFGKIKESNECLFKAMAVIPLINVFERHEAYTAIGKEVILECKCYLLDFISRHVLETAHELADDWFDYIGTSQVEMIKSELLELRRKANYEKIKDIILNQNYINKLELFNDYIFTQCSLTGDLTNLKIHLLNSITLKKKFDEKNKNKNLEEIAYCFIKTEEIEKSNSIAVAIHDPFLITKVLVRIAIEKIRNDDLDFIDYLAQNIIFNDEKFEYYRQIVEFLISVDGDLDIIKTYLKKMNGLVSKKLNSDGFLKKAIILYERINEFDKAYCLSTQIWNVDDKEIFKNGALRNFGKSNNLANTMEFVKGLAYLPDKILGAKSIISELQRQGRIVEAINYADEINIELSRSEDYTSISALSVLHGNLKREIPYSFEVPSFDDLKVEVMNAILVEIANGNYYLNNLTALQLSLQEYALIQLFSESLSEKKIELFNSTLNIQWAIDIKNSFVAN